jgi:hypothetical protein
MKPLFIKYESAITIVPTSNYIQNSETKLQIKEDLEYYFKIFMEEKFKDKIQIIEVTRPEYNKDMYKSFQHKRLFIIAIPLFQKSLHEIYYQTYYKIKNWFWHIIFKIG